MNPNNPTFRYTPIGRAKLYNERFPKRPPLAADGNMLNGCWMIGACYKNPNPLYGAYPHGYLERVHAMFPEAVNILHVFSGGLTHENAMDVVNKSLPPCGSLDPIQIELVDMHGPEQGRHPTWQGDLFDMPEEWAERFDLILADPPYSADDAVKYDCPAPNRGKIMRALRRVAKPGGSLVWLDQVWPMHRKADWRTYGTIGLVRSTNHRMRLVSMFEAV
jgi:hypothetical protein